jgi:hypothetical protein
MLSKFSVRDVLIEGIAHFEEQSFISSLVTRQLEQSNICTLQPKNWQKYLDSHWSHLTVACSLSETDTEVSFKDFDTFYIKPTMQALATAVDAEILQHSVAILLASHSCSPNSIVGIQDCMNWLKERFQYSHTRTANRSLILTPASDIKLIRDGVDWNILYKDFDSYMCTSLKNYNLAIQRDAITLTSLSLPKIPDLGYSKVETYEYNGFGLRAQSRITPGGSGMQIKFDCAVQVTKVNTLHCELISEKAFCN